MDKNYFATLSSLRSQTLVVVELVELELVEQSTITVATLLLASSN